MFAIMGATGHVGRVVINALDQSQHALRALTRNPKSYAGPGGAKFADPQDADSLAKAFDGARGVFVMIPPYWQAKDHSAEGQRAVKAIGHALRISKPDHVVLLSSEGAHLSSGTGPIKALHLLEGEIRTSGVPTTILRASYFMDNWAPLLPVAQEAGVLPSGQVHLDRAIEMVSTQDIGKAAAWALLEGAGDGTRILNVVGPGKLAPNDVAKAVSTILGKPITAVPQAPEDVHHALVSMGASASYADALVELYDGINTQRIEFEPNLGETVKGQVDIVSALQKML